jgi:hypothetical protein
VLRATEGGEEDQGGRSRVEADDGRDARDGGVGERLGHEHGPHREASEHVAAVPPPPRFPVDGAKIALALLEFAQPLAEEHHPASFWRSKE